MLPYTVVEFEIHNFLHLRISYQRNFSGPGFLHTFYTHKASIYFHREDPLKKFIPLSLEGILFSSKVLFIQSRSFASLCPWLLVQRMARSINVSSSTSSAKSDEDV